MTTVEENVKISKEEQKNIDNAKETEVNADEERVLEDYKNKHYGAKTVVTYEDKKVSDWKPGDIVWAKYEDSPFWPGRIATTVIAEALRNHKKREQPIEAETVCVLFFGKELTYGLVAPHLVCDFKPHYARYSKEDNTDDFEEAVRMAHEDVRFMDPPLELTFESDAMVVKVEATNEPKTGIINEAGEDLKVDEEKKEETKVKEEKKEETKVEDFKVEDEKKVDLKVKEEKKEKTKVKEEKKEEVKEEKEDSKVKAEEKKETTEESKIINDDVIQTKQEKQEKEDDENASGKVSLTEQKKVNETKEEGTKDVADDEVVKKAKVDTTEVKKE